MVLALAAGFPGVTEWRSTDVKESGVRFWLHIAEKYGIRLAPFNSPEQLVRKLAVLEEAEEQFGDTSTLRRTSHLRDLRR